jgi:hypothetical protein
MSQYIIFVRIAENICEKRLGATTKLIFGAAGRRGDKVNYLQNPAEAATKLHL